MTRVLIADDHALLRSGLRGLLEDEIHGVTVLEVPDSVTALESITRDAPDLVLLDLDMPGRGGLDVLTETRRLRPDVPVLILSAYREEEFAVRAFRLGAAGYLNKQAAAEELVVAVRKVLSGGRYVSSALAERLAGLLGSDLEQAPHELLSPRELEVLRLVAGGRTARDIAVTLHLSEKTIATYRARIATKLGVSTNVELARYALKHGLVD